MLTKTKSITFTELKQIRKEYLSLINHCESLISLEEAGGVQLVINALETRYKNHLSSKEDIAALHFIIDHYELLRHKLTWY